MEVEYNGIVEKIEIYTFRNSSSLKIPKRIREKAFTLQIDIEIVSVSASQYLNFKSNPPNGFYGYVTLVRRDYCPLIIPIQQPRQNIFYERNDMAHSTWYSLYLDLRKRLIDLQLFNTTLDVIAIASGADLPIVNISCPIKPLWEEIGIRELYVKCPFGTQFKVEISWFEARPMEIGECSYDGTSGFQDGDKDNGLPEKVLPNDAGDLSNPFDGLQSPSSQSALGDLFNNKGSDFNERLSREEVEEDRIDRPATLEEEGYYYVVRWTTQTSGAETCQPVNAALYIASNFDVAFENTSSSNVSGSPCVGATIQQWRLFNPDGSTFFDRGGSFVTSGVVAPFQQYGILPFPDGSIQLGD